MKPATPLRLKILLLTAIPIAALVFGALWTVNRQVSRQTAAGVQDDLTRSAAVFENMLGARARELGTEGQVIAQDPKFFAMMGLPGGASDPLLRDTMMGVARDFNAVIGRDLFEVFDQRGRLFASAGASASSETWRSAMIASALEGRPASGLVLERGTHFQVSATPVVAGGRVVGVLVLGSRLGAEVGERLRHFTRSEVSFFAGNASTMSTHPGPGDLERLTDSLRRSWNALLAAGPGGRLEEIRAADDVWLTLLRPIPGTLPSERQYYALQRSLGTELRPLRDVRSSLLVLGVAALAVALLAGLVIAQGLVAPIHRLVRAAEEMERGNFEAPLDIHRRDELGDLAGRFDAMRRRQRAYISSLEEVTRLKTEFISVASHELRTPISIIQGFHELMAHGLLGPVSAEQTEALSAISHSTKMLLRIADDATRVAQIQGARLVVKAEEHSVGDLIGHAVGAARAAGQGREVAIVHEIARGSETATFDGPQLAETLTHLVSNGIRFTPDGGEVRIVARREGGDLVIAVRDSGIGIPEERQSEIFERSITVRSAANHHSSGTLEFNSRGLGLGLSIARGIVEAHGGTITLESAPGRGSTFTLRIPAYPEESRQAA